MDTKQRVAKTESLSHKGSLNDSLATAFFM